VHGQKCCLKNNIRRRITMNPVCPVTWPTKVTKLNTQVSRTLRQISGCDRRQLYQISNWYVQQNSLIGHTEKFTHNNLFRLVDWLNRQWSFIVILFAYMKLGRLRYTSPLFFYFACQLKQRGWDSVKCLDKGERVQKVWKTLI